MQLKQDIHRYISSNNYEYLESQFNDDSMDYTKNKNELKYFSKNDNSFVINDEDKDLSINISLDNLNSKYNPLIKFNFIANIVDPRDESNAKEIEFNESDNLITFMNDWSSNYWSSLFDRFLSKVRSDLNIKSKTDFNSSKLPDTLEELISDIYKNDHSKPKTLKDFINLLMNTFDKGNVTTGNFDTSKLIEQLIISIYNENNDSKNRIKNALLDIKGSDAKELAEIIIEYISKK